MTTLLAFVTVAAFGTWIPLAQLLPGVPQRFRIFYVAVGNLAVAAIALLAGGGRLELGWRGLAWRLSTSVRSVKNFNYPGRAVLRADAALSLPVF